VKLLVVDDDRYCAELLARLLQALGHDPIVAF